MVTPAGRLPILPPEVVQLIGSLTWEECRCIQSAVGRWPGYFTRWWGFAVTFQLETSCEWTPRNRLYDGPPSPSLERTASESRRTECVNDSG